MGKEQTKKWHSQVQVEYDQSITKVHRRTAHPAAGCSCCLHCHSYRRAHSACHWSGGCCCGRRIELRWDRVQQADDLTASAASGWAQQAGLAQLDEVRPGPGHLAAVEDGGDRE